jgi:hypothetical protein
MSAKIRYYSDPGQSLSVTIERLADGLAWDNVGFSLPGSATKAIPLSSSSAPWTGRYELNLNTTGWKDGSYAVHVHRVFAGSILGSVIGILSFTLVSGDDAPVAPLTVVLPAGTSVKTA